MRVREAAVASKHLRQESANESFCIKREMGDMGMSLKTKTMRPGDNYHYNHIIILGENNVSVRGRVQTIMVKNNVKMTFGGGQDA